MSTKLGLITVNHEQILHVDATPSGGGGTPAPMGSMAMLDDGTSGYVYIKVGPADIDWREIDFADTQFQDWNLDANDLTGGTPTTPDQRFGSRNDYDVRFQRNAIEIMRMVSQGLLIGLSSSIGGRLQVGVAALGDEILRETSPNGGSGARVVNVSTQYKVQTTDGVATTLADIAVPTGAVIHITLKVVARQHSGVAGTPGDGACYTREIHARNNAGTVTVRQNQTSWTSEDQNQWNVTVGVSTTNVRIQVLGQTDKNIAWSAHAEWMIAID